MTIVLLILTLLVLSISAFLYRKASGESVFKMNMLNYSFWMLGIISVPGSISVFLDLPLFGYDSESNRLIEWYGTHTTKGLVLIYIVWMMAAIPIGAMICNLLFKVNVRNLLFFYRSKSFAKIDRRSEKILFNYVVLVGLFISFLVISFLPSSNPLTILFSGGNVIEAQISRNSLYLGTGIQFIDMIINEQLVQLFCFISLAGYYIFSSVKWKTFFYMFLFVSIYIAVASGSTSKLLYFFLGIAFQRAMITGIFIKIKELIFLLIALVPMFIFFKGANGSFLSIIMDDIVSRIFLTQCFGFYAALTIFPKLTPHINFSSTGKFLHEILGLNFSEDYGRIMIKFTHYDGYLEGHAGHVTTIFMGEAWANFGLIGIVFAPLWVGFFVQFVNLFFLKKAKTIYLTSVYTTITLTFAYARDFISFYYFYGFLVSALGFYIFYKILSLFAYKFY